MADIYRYISYIFLFVQVLYSEYHCAAAHNSVRLIGLFRKGHNCAQSCVWARRRSYCRARENPELLHGNLGLGKSVIITASGHRVASERSQDITIDSYIPSGMNGIYREYHYGIYRAGKLTSNYLCFHFWAFLTKVKKFSSKVLRDYTSENSKKLHAYYREHIPWLCESFFPSKQ